MRWVILLIICVFVLLGVGLGYFGVFSSDDWCYGLIDCWIYVWDCLCWYWFLLDLIKFGMID